MKRLDRETLLWLERRNKKLMRRRTKRKKKSRFYHAASTTHYSERGGNVYPLVAPEHFSLLEYTEETIQYFSNVKAHIAKAVPGDELYFDFSHIQSATPDAFLYVVALLHDNKKLNTFDISCRGNEPIAEEPKKVLNRAGFFKYVRSKAFHPKEDEDEQLRIYRGTASDPTLAGKICQFVHRRTENDIDRIGTKRLYAMLVELMSNTEQHAFSAIGEKRDPIYCNWYSYAEDLGDSLRFVFLDTGMGIPYTIRKNFLEKISIITSDSKFISSALMGTFRTDTNEHHRGKGLPEIYGSVQQGGISELQIFSGKGLCIVQTNHEIKEIDLPVKFDGTLFAWTIKKGEH